MSKTIPRVNTFHSFLFERDFEKQLDAIRREMEQDIVQLKFSLEHERSTNQGLL